MGNELVCLEDFQRAAATGLTEAELRQLEAHVVARREERGGHAQWGLLCEQCGLWQLAFREFQLALRDDPNDPVALERLACLYRERGELDRAAQLWQRLTQLQPQRWDAWQQWIETLLEQDALTTAAAAFEQAATHGMGPEPLAALRALVDSHLQQARSSDDDSDHRPEPSIFPTEADCIRFCGLFAGREDVYARQWARGTETGYTPVHEPLTPTVAKNHLLGNYTIGVYPLRLDGTATFFALDLDIDRSALQRARSDPQYAQWLRDTLRKEAPRLVEILNEYGFSALFENSGYKGRHYWVFLEKPETAATLQVLGKCLLQRLHPFISPGFHLEFFPKQSELKGKGLGNLIKLPLGIHRRTGKRSLLLDPHGQVISDPLAYLRNVRRCSTETLYAAIERLKHEVGSRLTEPAATATVPAEPEAATEATEPPQPPMPPIPAPPQWTEGDFVANPEVRHMLDHCPVLAELKRRADEHRHLTYDEQLVLMHTLGHLESGPLAVNYLLEKCVDVGPDKLMKARFRGNPMSCPTIRRKIPHITSRVPCNCDFSFASDRYPSPVVHLVTLSAKEPDAPCEGHEPLPQVAHRLAHLEQRLRELAKEQQSLRDHLVERLRQTPERSVSCPAGSYRLVENEGVEELVFEASTAPHDGNGTPPSATSPESTQEKPDRSELDTSSVGRVDGAVPDPASPQPLPSA
ncbi:MAG: hypothetical protein KatS3mg110_3155 [Pirellulaceae bacterium]|nr:MAG: hypothetical protein KatS3mg110_3155 [Pirellulaceae bacterium]